MAPRVAAWVSLGLAAPALAIDNGLGRTPPMGWRSWNLYGGGVDQKLMMGIMDGMVARKRLVDGKPTSLCDLGFCDVGLDDNWQACGQGTDGYRYHAASGNSYHSVINTDRFPDMAAMTARAHMLGLTAGWYHNNCMCNEEKAAVDALYEGDAAAIFDLGYDAVKLDGCGTQKDLDLWSNLLNKTGKAIMIENCHWGQTVPTATWCPWNFFRTSGDIRASYGSMVGNLQTTIEWARQGLSRPGCWGYPDMLQVGVQHGPGGADDPGLSFAETRAHFGAWCIVSSPLTLSHDVNNDTVSDLIWPIIANVEAIAVNQAWAGHSGSPFKESSTPVQLAHYYSVIQGAQVPHVSSTPSWQYFYKPLGGGKTAVLLMNHDSMSQNLTLAFADVPNVGCTSCAVRDIWERKDLGVHQESISVAVASHDAAFFVLAPQQSAELVV